MAKTHWKCKKIKFINIKIDEKKQKIEFDMIKLKILGYAQKTSLRRRSR